MTAKNSSMEVRAREFVRAPSSPPAEDFATLLGREFMRYNDDGHDEKHHDWMVKAIADLLRRHATAVASEERERCANVVEGYAVAMNDTRWREYDALLQTVASALRTGSPS